MNGTGAALPGTDLARDTDFAAAAPAIAAVRRGQPLVHCITATVSMNFVANGLLAAGARPMMTETVQEAPVITGIADCLLVNVGTLSTDAMEGIRPTVRQRISDGQPWVLDPTAIGRAPVRTPLARDLLDSHPAVVRGNASEILALTGGKGGRGADSAEGSGAALAAARQVSARTGGAVAVSGSTDLIVGPNNTTRTITRGHPLLTRVTGTGCLLGAMTAACMAACDDLFEAASAATLWMNIAGELAASRAPRPGSFRIALLDALDEVGEVADHMERNAQHEEKS
ncbi:MAG: hydroxyethylthiazole kinase [Ancrocorticia sp.]|uniref:hydroxyethylthiazole kinase n=1 Tax=Ancrocorticia sp. TaxID=2593684 RepID=UPI003F917F06